MKNRGSELQSINKYILDVVEQKKPETVKKLVQLVQAEYALPEKKIIDQILNLQSQGRLVFKPRLSQLPPTPRQYLFSSHAAWYWAVVALALTTSILVFTVPENAYPITYVRYVFGSIFVLWLPGYALVKALFPTKELENVERIAISVGMSLALVPIVGLLLNYTPLGIKTAPITFSLLALTITFSTVAVMREQKRRT